MTSLPFGTASHLINEGNLATLNDFIDGNLVTIQDRDENGQTLLMIACQAGNYEIVRELIRQGADVNAEDSDNWTPLINASKQGSEDIVRYLVSNGSSIEHREMGGWTAVMWACYKGHADVVQFLLNEGACSNVYDAYHVSCLIWAAGRGHHEVVQHLIASGAKLNTGDKYGTTPLVWSSRKGHTYIVKSLLEAGANVDTAGMYSWTALIVAAKGNFVDIVSLVLEYKPNVNALDKDGCTALTISCKEGFTEIAVELMNAGAYINLQDKNLDSNLILASRAGHYSIVDALLKKYADIDIQGADGKTALYWAVEKNHSDIVRILLSANPNLEIATKDGDTPLLKATRNRHVDIVQLLMDKKAKVSAADKKGDTALHIAMRASSKGIVEVLLRNPKNSQLLYRPNRAGETPYNIDASHQKSILAQIFGARRLNTNEDSENMLGYDLYSSALADILSEPSLSMPISVGLYAKWGSGKSFLLNKLEEEMKNFAIQWLESTFEFSWLAFFVVSLLSLLVGSAVLLISWTWEAALGVGLGFFVLSYITLGVIMYGTQQYDWMWAYKASVYLDKQFQAFKTLLQVVFCNPPATRKDFNTLPVKFLFTNHTKVSSSGGDLSVTQLIICLCHTLEEEYGYFTTRMFRVFRPKIVSAPSWRWRRLCCIPNFFIALLSLMCILSGLILLLLYLMPKENDSYKIAAETRAVFKTVLITIASVIAVIILSNLFTWVRIVAAVCISHQRRIQHNLSHLDSNEKSHLEAVKTEVESVSNMVRCLDSFLGQQTRLVVIVDGLDSCEQEKVLRILDAVHLLFSHPSAPFITILAIDPHIIIRAIEANIHRVFHNSSISGQDYLRNIVHLPFYLQNSGLRRVKAAQQAATQSAKRMTSYWNEEKECATSIRKASVSSLSIPDAFRKNRKGNHKLKASESMASSISNLHRMVAGAQDLTKVLLMDDYFSDVNPRSMRRLMNIVYVTGRLLKAFNIDFNWYHLASWINITEQWPYRTSWMIMYYERYDAELEDSVPLRVIYEKVKPFIPSCRELEPMIDLDHDERKFEVFLSFHSGTLLMNDMKVFLPFTINLDPFIRKTIQEDHQHVPDIFKADYSGGPHHPPPPQPPQHHQPTPVPSQNGDFPDSNNKWAYGHNYPRRYFNSHAPAVSPTYRPDLYHSAPAPLPCQRWDCAPRNFGHTYGGILKSGSKESGNSLENTRLSTLNVEGVVTMLNSLANIDKTKVKEYCASLTESNINGRVLLTCDLDELKKVTKMAFGDWELFRVAILALRDKELHDVSHEASMPPPIQKRHSLTPAAASTSKLHRSDSVKGDEKLSSEASRSDERRPSHRQRASSGSSVLEKQVTMEESLIVGALETLNEEAFEDASEEKKIQEKVDGGPNFLHSSNPLSPILSDPEELSGDDLTEISQSTVNTNTPQMELDVMYLKGPRSAPLLNSDSIEDASWESSQGTPIARPTLLLTNSQDMAHLQVDTIESAPTSLASSPMARDIMFRSLGSDFQFNPPTEFNQLLQSSEEITKPYPIQSSNLLNFITSSLETLPKFQACLPDIKTTNTCSNSDHTLLAKSKVRKQELKEETETFGSTEKITEGKSKMQRKDSKSRHKHVKVNHYSNADDSGDEETPLVSPIHLSRSQSKHLVTSPFHNAARLERNNSKKELKKADSDKRPPLERQISVETVSSAVTDENYSPVLRRNSATSQNPLHQFSTKKDGSNNIITSPTGSDRGMEKLDNSNETVL